MMKRRISMLMILLANILILAHAVVPHHHHDGESNYHNGSTHHHDGESEDCLMSEAEAAAVLKIQTGNGGNWSVEPLQDVDDGCSVLYAAIGLYELSFISNFSEDNVRRQPYVASGHTDFVAHSKGLRAPPAC